MVRTAVPPAPSPRRRPPSQDGLRATHRTLRAALNRSRKHLGLLAEHHERCDRQREALICELLATDVDLFLDTLNRRMAQLDQG